MSGAMIGMEKIITKIVLRPIQPDLPRVGSAFFVAAAGTATIGSCAYPIATPALLATVAATSVSASPSEFTTR